MAHKIRGLVAIATISVFAINASPGYSAIADGDKEIAAAKSKMASACGTAIKVNTDWKSLQPLINKRFEHQLAGRYCAAILAGVTRVCKKGALGKKAIADGLSEISCRGLAAGIPFKEGRGVPRKLYRAKRAYKNKSLVVELFVGSGNVETDVRDDLLKQLTIEGSPLEQALSHPEAEQKLKKQRDAAQAACGNPIATAKIDWTSLKGDVLREGAYKWGAVSAGYSCGAVFEGLARMCKAGGKAKAAALKVKRVICAAHPQAAAQQKTTRFTVEQRKPLLKLDAGELTVSYGKATANIRDRVQAFLSK